MGIRKISVPPKKGCMMLPVFDDSAVCKDIEAVCSKCGESWHIIVAVADGKIAQVECKSCGARHKYKPIARDRMTLKRDTKTALAVATKTGTPIKEKKAPTPKELVPKVPANDRPIRKWSIKEKDFQLGDRIEHVKFGLGVVDELPSPNKMYVTFREERVLLVYGK